MQLNLNTKAEGKYYFYTTNNEDESELTLVGESDNLITSVGLSTVAIKKWCECFKTIRLGDNKTSPPALTDVALTNQVLSADSTKLPATPGAGAYVTGSYGTGGSVIHTMVRSWKIQNSTGADQVIKEVGTSPGVSDLEPLFSRSTLTTNVNLSAGHFLIALYELRLTTTSVLTGTDLTLNTGGVPAYQIPNNTYGILSCPFSYLLPGGATTASTPADGQMLFEPSNSTYYLGYITNATAPATCLTDFNTVRAAYQDITAGGPLTLAAATPVTYTIAGLGNTPYEFTADVYVPGTLTKTHNITILPAFGTQLNGLVVSTSDPTSTFTKKTGWHCVFNSTWNRPSNTYLELSITHTWS